LCHFLFVILLLSHQLICASCIKNQAKVMIIIIIIVLLGAVREAQELVALDGCNSTRQSFCALVVHQSIVSWQCLNFENCYDGIVAEYMKEEETVQ
jgi:hypothetical protein